MSPSNSRTSNDSRDWLEEQVYAPKRHRTVELVKQSVDTLVAAGKPVSVATIMKQAQLLNPEGRGLSHTAILNNPEARAYYEQHRTWQAPTKSKSRPPDASSTSPQIHIERERDLSRVYHRYLRMSKEELAERLVQTEQYYAEQQELWLQRQDEVLTWRLEVDTWRKRAEQAEAQLADKQST